MGTQRAPAVVVLEEHNALGLRPVHARDRILARLRTMSLDEQLAAGTSPESNVLLALHAARLSQPSQRRRLAGSLRAIALAAQRSRRTRAPIDREGVRLVLGELEAVATRLDTNEPIDVSGIARVPHAPRERRQPALSPIPSRSPATRAGVGPGCVRPIGVNARPDLSRGSSRQPIRPARRPVPPGSPASESRPASCCDRR